MRQDTPLSASQFLHTAPLSFIYINYLYHNSIGSQQCLHLLNVKSFTCININIPNFFQNFCRIFFFQIFFFDPKWLPGSHFVWTHDGFPNSISAYCQCTHVSSTKLIQEKLWVWEHIKRKWAKWPPGGHFEFDHDGFKTRSAPKVNIPMCQVRDQFIKNCWFQNISTEINKIAAGGHFEYDSNVFSTHLRSNNNAKSLCNIANWFEKKKMICVRAVTSLSQ